MSVSKIVSNLNHILTFEFNFVFLDICTLLKIGHSNSVTGV